VKFLNDVVGAEKPSVDFSCELCVIKTNGEKKEMIKELAKTTAEPLNRKLKTRTKFDPDRHIIFSKLEGKKVVPTKWFIKAMEQAASELQTLEQKREILLVQAVRDGIRIKEPNIVLKGKRRMEYHTIQKRRAGEQWVHAELITPTNKPEFTLMVLAADLDKQILKMILDAAGKIGVGGGHLTGYGKYEVVSFKEIK